MKLLIAVDMEGISGVTSWDHVDPAKLEYARFRRLMTKDVNAAIQGACEGGAHEVFVTDGHNMGANILIEDLDERAVLNCGMRPDLCMVGGVEGGMDAAMLIGYHARAGTQEAILCHTYTLDVANLILNGKPIGEIGLAAALCAHYDTPVIMVSGDQAACREAEDLIPGIDTAVVKTSSGQFAAECLPPQASRERIRAAARRAVERVLQGSAPAPQKTETPVRMQLQLKNPAQADNACLLPGFVRVNGTTFEFQGEDILSAYQALVAGIILGH